MTKSVTYSNMWEGVYSNFWSHVSQTREGFNPPLDRHTDEDPTPSLAWLTLDPCLSDGLSGGINPPFVWLTWIQKLDYTIPEYRHSAFDDVSQHALRHVFVDLHDAQHDLHDAQQASPDPHKSMGVNNKNKH